VAFPRQRFDDELIAEIEKFAPSQLEISDRDGDGVEDHLVWDAYPESTAFFQIGLLHLMRP
jgi:isocitrate dehydrogenase kinase/phosphatase